MMGRLFPIFLTLMVFTAFLAVQVFLDQLDIRATQSSGEEQKHSLYREQLKSLKARSFSGKEIDLTKNRTPVVILNFWASWCAPCLEEFPSLVQLRKKYRQDQVAIVGINSDVEEADKNVKKAYQKYGLNFPSIVDGGRWTEKFKIRSIPVTIIYLGNDIEVSRGARDFVDPALLKKIDQVLGKSR